MLHSILKSKGRWIKFNKYNLFTAVKFKYRHFYQQKMCDIFSSKYGLKERFLILAYAWSLPKLHLGLMAEPTVPKSFLIVICSWKKNLMKSPKNCCFLKILAASQMGNRLFQLWDFTGNHKQRNDVEAGNSNVSPPFLAIDQMSWM